MTNDLVTTSELFDLLAKATSDAVWHWDLDRDTIWWNEGLKTLFGHELQHNTSEPTFWYAHIHPDDKDRVVGSIHRVLDGGGTNWSAEYRFFCADGTTATVLDRGYVVHREGRAVRMVGAMQDITERVALQQQRNESEERLRFALESAQMGTWSFDPARNLASWDERCERLLGWVKGDLSYTDSLKHVHPDDRERIDNEVQRALNPESGGQYDTTFRTISTLDGKLRWVRFIGQTHFTDTGEAHRFSGVAQEITAQVLAQERAALVEQQARMAIESSGSGSFSIDVETNHMLYSPSLARIFTGEELGPVTRNTFIDHLHPDDRSIRDQAYSIAEQTNTIHYEARFIWNDKSVHWVKVIGQYLFNSAGKPVSLSGVALDITESKEQKKALLEAEQRFSIAFNNASVGMSFTDEKGNFTLANSAFIQLLGYPAPELYTFNFLDLTHPDHQDENRRLFGELTRGDRNYISLVKRYIRKDGSERWVQVNVTRIAEALEETHGLLVIANDISDRVATEGKLRASEERFRRMINQAPVAIGILNERSMVIETANLPMLELWGKDASIIGLPLLNALPEIEGQEFPRLLAEVFRSGNAHYGFETLAWLHRNGKLEEAYIDFVYAPAYDVTDATASIIVVATEVTQQVRAKKALQESEQRFRNLIEEAPIALNLFVGRDLVIEMPNEPMLKFWGKGNTVLNKPLLEALPELEGQPFLDILDNVYVSGIEYSAQEAAADIVVDGVLKRYYFNFTYKPLHDTDGRVYAIMCMATDVTEQVLTRRAIEESELRFRTLMEAIAQMTWTNTPDGKMNFFNQRWYDYTGLATEQAAAINWEDVVHPNDLSHTLEAYQKSLTDGTNFVVENRYRRGSDGTYRWHLNRAIPIRDEDGTITVWVGTATDIHEQKELAANLEEQVRIRTKELEASNYDLRRSNDNLEKFAYIASHDLQEPLRKIQSFGDILKTQYGSQLGDGAGHLERMQLAAVRMSLLIRDLLSFSQISTRQEKAAPVRLSKLVTEVLDDLEVVIEQAGAKILIDDLPTILGDASQLRQLFQNLLSNALKFRKAGITPHIQVQHERVLAKQLPPSVKPAREAVAYYCIQVTDNGIGFDEKYIDRIFQVFQRLHGRSEYAGTGVGLAICEKVVANHGGAITAVSQLGEGTTFLIYLPVN
ncbi:PAS domain-containing sensor histidine kinase [Spirosoma lituiforme]